MMAAEEPLAAQVQSQETRITEHRQDAGCHEEESIAVHEEMPELRVGKAGGNKSPATQPSDKL
jgi:hypothetical protein